MTLVTAAVFSVVTVVGYRVGRLHLASAGRRLDPSGGTKRRPEAALENPRHKLGGQAPRPDRARLHSESGWQLAEETPL